MNTLPQVVGFGQIVSQIYSYSLSVVGLAVFVMFLYAGIQYLNPFPGGGPEKAKAAIYDALIGTIILFSAYVILNSVNHNLVVQNGAPPLPVGNPITIIPVAPASGSGATGVASSDCPTGTCTETQARQALSASGIGWNANPCTGGQTTGCTTLAGESASNIQTIINVKNACAATEGSCAITVTGGDEPHPTTGTDPHAGGKAIDLAPSPTLDAYLGTLTPVQSFTPTAFADAAGNVYTLEGTGGATNSTAPHWHVAIK